MSSWTGPARTLRFPTLPKRVKPEVAFADAQIGHDGIGISAAELKTLEAGLFDFVKNVLAKRTARPEPIDWPQTEADRLGAIGILEEIQSQARLGLAELEALRQTVESGGIIERFVERSEECSRSFTNLLNRRPIR